MIRATMALLLALLLLISAGHVFGAEMAKEGSDTVKTGFISTYQVLAQGKEYLQINYVANGVIQTENEASPLYMSSTQCVGSIKAIKGEFKEFGLCTYTCPNGGQIYGSYEGTGKMGQGAKGSMTFVGGTEKLVGITGDGEWTRTSLKDPAKGVGASISKFTYNWKIPSE